MAHAILPGAAIAYLLSGLSLVSLTLGGLIAGIVVAALAGWVARSTHLKKTQVWPLSTLSPLH